MLNAMGVANLRSFPNKSQKVDIKPISILIGENSSGKSTFLRMLPLLRQSVEELTNNSILWYGRYVDFGDFSEAVRKNSIANEIIFDFEISIDNFNERLSLLRKRRRMSFRNFSARYRDVSDTTSLNVSLGISRNETTEYVSSLSIDILGVTARFIKKGKYWGLFLDGDEYKTPKNSKDIKSESQSGILPEFFVESMTRENTWVISEEGDDRLQQVTYEIRNQDYKFADDYYEKLVVNSISPFLHGNVSDSKIKSKYIEANLSSVDTFKRSLFNSLSEFTSFKPSTMDAAIGDWDLLRRHAVKSQLSDILFIANDCLTEIGRSVRYVAPIRATAERFYRNQNLSVEEIDHNGSNLAMFLKSLSPANQLELKKWTREHFLFEPNVVQKGLHYEIKIKDCRTNDEQNITDMGFGFSQILPIIVTIWSEIYRNTRNRRPTRLMRRFVFAIEQPELHLHPGYQRRFANTLASIVEYCKEVGRIHVSFVIETHSKYIVDSLGENIEEGRLDKDSVSISYFEKRKDLSETIISRPQFDEYGYLINLPQGFVEA